MDSSDSDLDGVNHDVDVEEDEDEDVLEMQMNVGDCGGACDYVFEPEPLQNNSAEVQQPQPGLALDPFQI